jgi:hypothetical protein
MAERNFSTLCHGGPATLFLPSLSLKIVLLFLFSNPAVLSGIKLFCEQYPNCVSGITVLMICSSAQRNGFCVQQSGFLQDACHSQPYRGLKAKYI